MSNPYKSIESQMAADFPENDSAAELKILKPANIVALVSDNLRLPQQADGHDAHRDNTNGQNQAHL